VIKLKKKDFQDLKQGSMSINEYVTKFTQLCRYALHKVDTDEKKQDCFLNGLNDGLAYALEARDIENIQGMVNKALVLENHRGVMECKRKSDSIIRAAAPDHVLGHLQLDLCSVLLFQLRPQSAGQGFFTPQCQLIQHPDNFLTSVAGNQNV
jgi:hypothetical protein